MIVPLPPICENNCALCFFHAMLKNNPQPQRPPNRQRPNKLRPTTTKPANDDDGKKKQVRGHNLGVVAELGARIQEGDRGHDEETQGESQTPKGVWVSPAPERKKKRDNGAVENTQRKREREGTTNILAYRGQVLKGTETNIIPTPETKPQIE